MMFSPKQRENWRHTISDHHRWNVSTGATRAGKTHIDYYKIPYRIRAAGPEGLIFLLGNTEATLERNILAPMRDIYGKGYVGHVSRNRLRLFGREVWALGADKASTVKRIQGSSLAYCYGDEVTTWSEPVFTMLKSRLDRPGACFDGTANPDNPKHWFKRFIDSDADVYAMRWRIDDNPFNDPEFVRNLKNEYKGTVYYDRFIEGLWAAAEGVIYRRFADDPGAFIIRSVPMVPINNGFYPDLAIVTIGVDFGGTKSAQAFQCTGISRDFRRVYTLDEFYTKDPIIPEQLCARFVDFVRQQIARGYRITEIRADSAEPVLIRGLQAALLKAGIALPVRPAIKSAINDRIRFYTLLMGAGAYKVMAHCGHTIDALSTAVWDPKSVGDKRLDDGTYNIDTLDAQEYSTEPMQKQILKILMLGGNKAA